MKKLRLLPPLITFAAGAIASVLLYLFRIDILSMLLILLLVLAVFYVIGVLAMKILIDCRPKEKEETVEEAVEETDGEIQESSEENIKG